MAELGKALPVSVAGKKNEVRTFMPKLGSINERRNQLHEVIRLSGINIPIDDTDHPLIIKVASMQPSRIQVYFIDNDDYFLKNANDSDPSGSNREDNDERAMFFARGALETAKKLRWDTDMIQCTGWFTALIPLYLKKAYSDNTSFKGTKVIYCIPPQDNPSVIDKEFLHKLKLDGFSDRVLKPFAELKEDPKILHKLAIAFSDGVIFSTPEPDEELKHYADSLSKPVAHIPFPDADINKYQEFFESLPSNNTKK